MAIKPFFVMFQCSLFETLDLKQFCDNYENTYSVTQKVAYYEENFANLTHHNLGCCRHSS